MAKFNKWTSIEKFSDAVIQAQRQYRDHLWFRPKVKLHGTNAGVRVYADGSVTFQKRSNHVDVTHDNAGFAAWATQKDWAATRKVMDKITKTDFNIWGEWAGPGIQNGVDAVGKTDKKRFFVFTIELYNLDGSNETDSFIIAEPERITEILTEAGLLGDDVVVLPWADEPKKVRFFGDVPDTITPQEYAEILNAMVEKMETRDDYIFENYGVDAPGEGYVVYPLTRLDHDFIDRTTFGSYVFKAKTEAHSASKVKGVKVKVEVPTSFLDFVSTYVTEARCEQMIQEHCEGVYSMKNTPVFMRALIADIEKETNNEREAGGIEMKDVSKLIAARGVDWLKKKCQNL